MQKTARWLLIAAVCLLAWTMFVTDLDARSMWLDEHQSWKVSREGPIGILQATAADVHPPFYYLWVWSWMRWTGSEDLFVMRLTAAIPALLAVAVCFKLGRQWFNNSDWAGAGAALFLATSSIFVNYGRELRMYALIIFLILLNWWFLYQLIKGKKYSVAGYTITLALMAYTYYFSAFVMVAQVVTVILFYRNQLRRVLLAFGMTLLLVLPWLPTFVNQMVTARQQAGDAENLPIIGKFLGTTPTSFASIAEFIDIYSAGQVAFVALLVVLALTLLNNSTSSFRRWLVAAFLWFFLTITLFFGLNLFIPIYGLRYVLVVIPGLALLVGAAIYRLSQNRARMGVLAIVAVTGILTHTHSFQEVNRPPHRELLQVVDERYLPGDRIWYNPPLGARGSNIWDDAAYHLQMDAPELSTDWFVWDAPNDFSNVATTPRVWDVRPYWVPILADTRDELETGRTISEQFVFENYTVNLYEAPPAGESPVLFGERFEMLLGLLDRATYQTGDTVVGKTWWRVIQPTGDDYSYTVILRRPDGQLISQSDHALQVGGEPTPFGLNTEGETGGQTTSAWSADAPYTLATPNVTLPTDLPSGEYELWVGVYFWQNPERLSVEAVSGQTIDSENRLARIGVFTVD